MRIKMDKKKKLIAPTPDTIPCRCSGDARDFKKGKVHSDRVEDVDWHWSERRGRSRFVGEGVGVHSG